MTGADGVASVNELATTTFAVIHSDHPALRGHFPGKAIVPGVVLLTEVWRAVRRQFVPEFGQGFGGGVKSIGLSDMSVVKFHSPLEPEQPFRIKLVRTGDSIRFTVHRDAADQRDAVMVLSGRLRCGDPRHPA